MPDDGNRSNSALAFLAGAALVLAIGIGVLAYTDNLPFQEDEPSLEIKLPDIEAEGG
ncbi:MAG: hypothetical protein ACQEUZ_05280 [Pseudomonadota bacterium]